MQQEDVVRATVREQILDLGLDVVRRLVVHNPDVEVTDLRVTEHPSQGFSVCRRGQQVPQPFVLVLVVGDDQGLSLAVHYPPSPGTCRLTNNPISRSWSAAEASESSNASPSISSRTVRRAPSPRA